MNQRARTLQELKADRRAVAVIEYGLIAGLVVVLVTAVVSVIDLDLTATFMAIGAKF